MPITKLCAHESDLNLDPIVAWTGKVNNDYCEFYNHDEDKYRGICRVVDEAFTCVRNKPIEYADDRDEVEIEMHNDSQNIDHKH